MVMAQMPDCLKFSFIQGYDLCMLPDWKEVVVEQGLK
jgi:hypothetical protein